MEELHISTQQYSYIIAAYSAAYTVMQPVAGYVLDILGTKSAMPSSPPGPFSAAQPRWQAAGAVWRWRAVGGAAEAAMIPAGLKAS
jgi:ACS family hexuronate transporter-like MFS transporter